MIALEGTMFKVYVRYVSAVLMFCVSIAALWAGGEGEAELRIELENFQSDVFLLRGVVPVGWNEVSAGVYVREEAAVATSLVQQSAPNTSIDELAAILVGQLGIDALPEAEATILTGQLAWTPYNIEINQNDLTIPMYLALAERDGTSYIVMLQVSPDDDAELLYEQVFYLAVDALSPISEASIPVPPYVDDNAFREEEIEFGTDEYPLPGTLAIPRGNGPFPAVVIVHGSGSIDRDGWLGAVRVYRDVAQGLASRGIASFRYDKRSFVYPSQEAVQTLDDETVMDALEAVAFVRDRGDIDGGRIFVVGHSQGGFAAPRIASLDSDIAGIVMMAANARPLDLALRNQGFYLRYANPTADLSGLMILADNIAELRRGRPAEEVFDDPLQARYWESMVAYDPIETARSIDTPMLFLQGERDYQVTMEDFSIFYLALSGKDARFIRYPPLSHLFTDTGDQRRWSIPADYGITSFVERQVIDDIVEWIENIE